jgi:hypothetical protein
MKRMDREIPNEGRELESGRDEVRGTHPSRPEDLREARSSPRSRPSLDRPEREYQLGDSERRTMADIGRFRTVSIEDLRRQRYNGNAAKMQQDVRHLSSQKLVRTRSLWLGKEKDPLEVITLTRRGKRLLERTGEQGTFYAGFVKPAEMAHDAAIYRMYEAEAARIAKQGGEIRRITLDYELKRQVYSPLAKIRPGSPVYTKQQTEIAARYGLKVVRGHIQLPDLRIEYVTRDGEIETTDLELATPHYRPGQLGAKAQAGFKFYANRSDQARLSAVFDDHDITSEILWL